MRPSHFQSPLSAYISRSPTSILSLPLSVCLPEEAFSASLSPCLLSLSSISLSPSSPFPPLLNHLLLNHSQYPLNKLYTQAFSSWCVYLSFSCSLWPQVTHCCPSWDWPQFTCIMHDNKKFYRFSRSLSDERTEIYPPVVSNLECVLLVDIFIIWDL